MTQCILYVLAQSRDRVPHGTLAAYTRMFCPLWPCKRFNPAVPKNTGVSTCKRDPNDVIHTFPYFSVQGYWVRVGPGYMHFLLVLLHVLNAPNTPRVLVDRQSILPSLNSV